MTIHGFHFDQPAAARTFLGIVKTINAYADSNTHISFSKKNKNVNIALNCKDFQFDQIRSNRYEISFGGNLAQFFYPDIEFNLKDMIEKYSSPKIMEKFQEFGKDNIQGKLRIMNYFEMLDPLKS